MNREDDDQLWDLLGQAQQPAVSPFFARNVLRRVREQPQRLVWVREWLNLRSLIPASTVAVAFIVAAFVVHSPHPRSRAIRIRWRKSTHRITQLSRIWMNW
jgi:hypothetical protein